ncbi:tetratricopeptide repeat protein [Rheinheimera sp. UJ63]|uniref:tetratricopeptide repeat protein n=1 Tax=Rheinheimera sp. UJ63 TaxID=2910157 RepID=UPI001F2F3521|nr:tetratricopeptide repeat protein [Rheinheimera sp. UJ63]MCF4010165.1 sel1 repeat family protein [Rheinheimera sp. UJ63]
MRTYLKYLLVTSVIVMMLPLRAETIATSSAGLICAEASCQNKITTLHRMARFGSFEAMTLLSMIYATGDGREQDPKKALSFLQRAVNHKHPMAVFMLSEWYREGFVVEQDLAQADALLTQSASLKHAPALYKKALLLLSQPDTDNVLEGMTLLEQASELRSVDAMFLLARLKQKGIYTETDVPAAAQLFKRLVLSGHNESRAFLTESIALLTPKPDAKELVADLQQSLDIEVIKVVGHDISPDSVLIGFVDTLQSKGLYTRGSMNKIKTTQCNGASLCYSIKPERGQFTLGQVISGQQ